MTPYCPVGTYRPRTVARRASPPTVARRLGPPTVADVIATAAAESGFTVEQLVGPSQRRDLVAARYVAMAACRAVTEASYPTIAAAFNRNHATVIHGCRRGAGSPWLAALVARLAARWDVRAAS